MSRYKVSPAILSDVPNWAEYEVKDHNTVLYRVGVFDSEGFSRPEWRLRFHRTDILTFDRNGLVTINTGGWRTVTTKDRLNKFLPEGFHVAQRARQWYLLWRDSGHIQEIPLTEGLRFNPDTGDCWDADGCYVVATTK